MISEDRRLADRVDSRKKICDRKLGPQEGQCCWMESTYDLLRTVASETWIVETCGNVQHSVPLIILNGFPTL
jgi:hypothetical protein